MPGFSQSSLKYLGECHADLQKVAHEAIRTSDFKVICGHRGKEAQNKAYAAGNSKLKYPDSKHNKAPSLAMDCTPHPLDWEDIAAFKAMGEAIKSAARRVGVKISWGGDWKSFKDYPHFELP